MPFFLLDCRRRKSLPGPGDVVLLAAPDSHHLLHVLRAEPGLEVDLVDGDGHRFRGRLTGRQQKKARLEILAAWEDPGEKQLPRLRLACAVVKGRRFEWALEKSVELGVHEILPLRTERTVIVPGQGRQQRWQLVVETALKQCGRSFLPRLQPVTDLRSSLQALPAGPAFYGDVAETANLPGPADAPSREPEPDPPARSAGEILTAGGPAAGSLPATVTWFVGPEGGWSEAERGQLAAAGCSPLSLGPLRLRTETAAVAGLVLLAALRRSPDGTA